MSCAQTTIRGIPVKERRRRRSRCGEEWSRDDWPAGRLVRVLVQRQPGQHGYVPLQCAEDAGAGVGPDAGRQTRAVGIRRFRRLVRDGQLDCHRGGRRHRRADELLPWRRHTATGAAGHPRPRAFTPYRIPTRFSSPRRPRVGAATWLSRYAFSRVESPPPPKRTPDETAQKVLANKILTRYSSQ